jgi:hypothetical protein
MTHHLNSNLFYNAVNYGDLTNKTLEEIPLLEDSVDLRQLQSAAAALPPPATADDDDESSEEDEPVWQIKEHAMRK